MCLAIRHLCCLVGRLTLVRARDVNRRIERLGGELLRQRGSHRRYEATKTLPDGTVVKAATTVAQHAGDIPGGTLRQIEKDMIPVFGEGWLIS
jgi:predicted RNA binding protein YcfA (HicA-like mRNA interferase family)